jgi:hypothetical protein
MKRIFLSLMLLLVCVGCNNTTLTSTIAYTKGYSTTKWAAEFVLNTDLPEFPDKLNYYTTVKPEVTIEWVEAIGDKLGIIDEAGITGSGDRIIMSEDDKRIEVYTSTGAITIRGIHKPYQTDTKLTSSENAAVIAIEFVKYLGLWDDDIELKGVTLRYEGDPIKEEWGVSFNQYIDDYPLVGGSKSLSVIVNMYGTVLRAGIWELELESAGETDCITAQQAYAILLDGDALEFIVSSESKILINDVYMGYYLESQTELQEYVMPVYVFEGERVFSDGHTEIFKCYVNASK